MTQEAYKPLVEGANAPTLFLTNAAATYYTVPVSPDNSITHVLGIILCNEDTVSRTVTLHNCAEGVAAGTSNRVLAPLTMAAGQTVILCLCRGTWVMTKGMTIKALADANSVVTITISGCEVAP